MRLSSKMRVINKVFRKWQIMVNTKREVILTLDSLESSFTNAIDFNSLGYTSNFFPIH